MDTKRVYTFGNGKAEGKTEMKNLLGGKGANLAEMNLIGVPVPAGFTITTEVCAEWNKLGEEKTIEHLKAEVEAGVKNTEEILGAKFGDNTNPLLLSVRSGARVSMPGMMDTVLNLGMNDDAVEGLAKKSNNPRFAWDSYRRFVQMYGDVVLDMKPKTKMDIDPFEEIIEYLKERRGIKLDTEFTIQDLKDLVEDFKDVVKKRTGKDGEETVEKILDIDNNNKKYLFAYIYIARLQALKKEAMGMDAIYVKNIEFDIYDLYRGAYHEL